MKDNVSKFTPGTFVPECKYDPVHDISSVDQVGFVDLHDAFVNASIPGDLSVNEESYNGVDDPASLVGRSADVFEAFRKASAVKSAEAANAAKATPEGNGE